MMTDRIEHLERRIEELAERVRRVEASLQSNTADGLSAPVVPIHTEDTEPLAPASASPTTAVKRISATVVMSLLGRSLIVMGGAFLLRWLTQSETLPQKAGAVLGMVYALLWIAMADINAGRGRRHSAAAHGITGTLIVLPLLVEVTTKFHYLTPMLSAIHLFAFIILGLVVAWRRNIRVLAWIVALPAAPLAFLLAVETNATTPFMISLLIIGFATLWLGYLRHWHFLATLMAAAVNLGMALMVMDYVAVSERVGAEPTTALWQVLFLLFALVALYFGSYCFRVFKRNRTITPIEIGNTLAVVLVGIGGAALVIHASENSMLPLGIGCITLAVAAYSAAYGLLPRQNPNRTNFLFYTLIALAMVLLGFEMSLPRPAAAVAMGLMALIAGGLAKRVTSPVLYLHGAVYLMVAMVRSGLLAATKHGLVGQSALLAEWMGLPLLMALVITVAYPWFPRPQGRSRDMVLGRRATDVFLLVTVLASSGLLVSLIARLGGENSEALRGLVASTRTGMLAISAVLVAWYGRRSRFGRLTWMAYTLLAMGAVKLVYEDISAGNAAALFLSLGLYGGALIIAPRLLHGAGKREVQAS